MSESILAELDIFVKTALTKKAEDPVLLDVRGLTSIADFFLILSGRSHRQVTAISEHVIKELKHKDIKSLNVEGIKAGHWVLIDYGYLVVHVFYDAVRRFYDLEGLWVDAKRLRTPSMLALGNRDIHNGDVEEILVE